MVTQISLGTFGTQNGKNVITGGATSIDTKGLIDGLVAAKRQPAVRLETANTTLDKKTTAFNELKTLFTKFQSAVDVLRNPPGVDTASRNIFEYRTASLVGTGGITASNYLDVTVEPGASAQSYTISSITQLAIASKQVTGDISIADTTTASAVTASGLPVVGLFSEGTVNLRAIDGTVGGIAVTLDQGDSLQAVANKFNEVSSRTGIQATILQVTSGTYKMIFTATETGTTYGFDLGLAPGAPGAGLESDGAGVFSQITATTVAGNTAQNAIFAIDGVSLTRESNSVADAVDNMTFNLKDSGLGAGSILVTVKPDTALVTNAIQAFVDSYNEFRLFAAEQSEVDDNFQPKETAVLNTNTIFRTIINDISAEVAAIIGGLTTGDPTQLLDIGLKLENFAGDSENLATKNILTVETETLSSALTSNFSGVRKLFEFNQTSDNSNFVNAKRSNRLNGVTSFTVTIDQTGGTYVVDYIDPIAGASSTSFTATAITGGGVGLVGLVDTPFEGMEYVFASTADAVVNVTMTQGFGDRFYNAIDSYLDIDDGIVTNELEGIADSKERNTEDITKIDDRLAAYRDKLVQEYASLEGAITKANQLLQLLDAQSRASSSSNN